MRLPALTLFCAAILLVIALPAPAQTRSDDGDTAYYERIGTLIYGVQRLQATAVPTSLAGRIDALAAQRDAIVNMAGRVPAAQLDAALRAMQDVTAELAAWRKGHAQ